MKKKVSNKLKLLIVCTVPTAASGIPMVIFNLLRALDRKDMEIGYVSINVPEERFKKDLEEMGIKLWIIPRKLSNPFSYVYKLSKIAKHYDIIHTHGNSATMLLEMLAARLGVVCVRGAHAHNTSCSMKWCDRICRPIFYSLCNFRLACGEAAGRWLFRNRKFEIINNGVDTERFRFNPYIRISIRTQLGLQNKKVIGHVGNFVEAKNHSFLIDVFAEAAKMDPNIHLLLLGDGGGRKDIENKVKSLRLNNRVIFTGSVSNTQDYMSAMDVVVMPSLYEGLPLTLVEEQACGLQILASDAITTQADMTGLIQFKQLDEGAQNWATYICRILNMTEKTDRSIISENAILDIGRNKYDIKSVSAHLKKLYTSELRNKHCFL